MSTINPDAIDTTKPTAGEALTADVRANEAATKAQFTAAKSDVEALEGGKEDAGTAAAAVTAHDGDSGAHGGVEAGLAAHEADTANPHAVTAAQAGADATGTAAAAVAAHDGSGAAHGGVEADFAAHDGAGAGAHALADGSNAGFMPQLSGTDTEFLNGTGAFSTPAGGGGGGILKGSPFVVGDLLSVESASGDGQAETSGLGAAAVAAHLVDAANPHSVTAAQAGADATGTAAAAVAAHDGSGAAHGGVEADFAAHDGAGGAVHAVVTDSALGFCPILSGNAAEYLDGSGAFSEPAGGGGSSTLAGLSDVTITSVATGEALVYTGAGWENQTLAEAGIEPAGTAAAAVSAHDVADEHIAHSGVTLTAGNGLSGGGTIAASRSFAVSPGLGITVGLAGYVGNTSIDPTVVSQIGHAHTMADISDDVAVRVNETDSGIDAPDLKVAVLTAAAYAGLGTPDANTLYFTY